MSELPESVLTLTQALQLVGLMPSIFVAVLLLVLSFRNRLALVPACYFLALACSFALPLVDVFFPYDLDVQKSLIGWLLFGESTLTAFSFLLIMQFIINRVPPIPYWLILAVPAVGGSVLIYASIASDASCAPSDICIDPFAAHTLYSIFSGCLTLLLVVYYAVKNAELHELEKDKVHRYWLVFSLIVLHLMLMVVALAYLSGHLPREKELVLETIFRLSFIYLVITSLFRVFYPSLVAQSLPIPTALQAYNPEEDLPHVATINALLTRDHIYREMRLNRAALAEKIGVSEHQLSRMINHHFQKNFNTLINDYRIEEAKRRLENETAQITVIGFEVGFNSIASFNRVFKQKVGISPTEYREKNASNP